MRAARNLRGTKFSKVFLKNWLSNEDINKKKLIRDKCYKLNQAHTPVADEKKRFVVIDGQIRQRHPNGKINFKKLTRIAVGC